jgi:hypothetical protein
MPIYHGKSADGSDMKEFKGFDVSPNGKYWGSEPINDEGEFIKDIKRKTRSRSKYHK